MGYSILKSTGDKLERNRREDRLCRGTGRSCVTRAKWRVTQEAWMYRIGEGASWTDDKLTVCNVHARDLYPGYQGVNFRVISVDPY